MERPNTIAGLLAKREELLRLRRHLEADLRKVTCDLDHLDAAVRLLSDDDTAEARARYATLHRAAKGQMRRFVLARLREAGPPPTSREVAEAWTGKRGLRADGLARNAGARGGDVLLRVGGVGRDHGRRLILDRHCCS